MALARTPQKGIYLEDTKSTFQRDKDVPHEEKSSLEFKTSRFKSSETVFAIEYPSAKLGVVTRWCNKIKTLMSGVTTEKERLRVKALLIEYNEKVTKFSNECVEQKISSAVTEEELYEFHEWEQCQVTKITTFQEYVNEWLLSVNTDNSNDMRDDDLIAPSDSASQVSAKSKFSETSSTNRTAFSMRAKMLQKQVELDIQEKFLKEKRKMDKEQRKRKSQREEEDAEHNFKMEQMEIELKKSEQKLFEKELNKLEVNNDRQSKISKFNFNRNENGEKKNVHSINYDDNEELSNLGSQAAAMSNSALENVLLKQNEISMMIMKGQDRASLPKSEPICFDGTDPTKFKSFLLSFKNTITRKCTNDSERFYYLETYTSGHAQELVRSCNCEDPAEGYHDAMKLLNEHYGNEYKISDSYITKLEKWQPIKSEDGKALEELSIFLISCCNMMKNISSLNQLNSPRTIQNVIKLLPFDLRKRWRDRACYMMNSEQILDFKTLVDFIKTQAQVVNLPMFGDIKDKDSSRNPSKFSQIKKRSFTATVANTTTAKECLVCKKDNHELDQCIFFNKKTHEEKIEFIKRNRLCFGCLNEGHMSKYCRNRKQCREKLCTKKHPTSLHRNYEKEKEWTNKNETLKPKETKIEKVDDKVNSNNSETAKKEETKKSLATNICLPKFNSRKVYAAVPVKIPVGNTYVNTYLGMDPWCSDCFIDNELAIKLNMKMEDVAIELTTLEKKKSSMSAKILRDLEISSLDEKKRVRIPMAYVKMNWPFELEDSPKPEDVPRTPEFKNIQFEFISEKVGILIGMDKPSIVKPLDMVCSTEDDGPYATLHAFGWAMNGPVEHGNRKFSCLHVKIEKIKEIEDDLQKFYLREFEDSHDETLEMSVEDLNWMKMVEKSTMTRNDGHLQVGLPFRNYDVVLPNNINKVKERFRSLTKRLQRDQNYFEEYNKFMQTMITSGFVEKVPEDEIETVKGKVWFLTHHGVYHPRKRKLRVVFDCSLKHMGICLNDQLLQGPDLTNNLLGVLLRFRQGKYAFSGDIEKMFYMVKVSKNDADFMRYLWFPGNLPNEEPVQYRLTVHVFGATSSPSCANFALRKTVEDSSIDISVEIKRTVLKSFYVDDCMKSLDNEIKALKLLNDVQDILAVCKFNLTSYTSNSRLILTSLPAEKLSKNLRELDLVNEDLPYECALGVVWNTEVDTLGFKINFDELKIKSYTRRSVLSLVCNLYDPFGFVSPVIIKGRKIFQETCRLKLGWDDVLPDEILEEWKRWMNSVSMLNSYEISRHYGMPINCKNKIELHCFSDGSEIAYGAVAYLRFVNDKNEIHCSLVMAKGRLTPLNKTAMKTTPRIELNGAKLSVKLCQILLKELEFDISKVYFWSDSSTVLSYIKSETGRFQRFVANRVAYIRGYTESNQWYHVPGAMNPADPLSRGMSVEQFVNNSLWKFGPEFLWKTKENWPQTKQQEKLSNDDPELKKECKMNVAKLESDPLLALIETSSNWHSIKRRFAWMLRLKKYLKTKDWKPQTQYISITELREAEIEILKYVQNIKYTNILNALKAENLGSVFKEEPSLRKLSPKLMEDGLIRMHGRLVHSPEAHDAKHPIILPKDSHVARLLVEDAHRSVGHLGREFVLSKLRERFWIIGGNSLVREIIRRCMICRKLHAKPSDQVMADLPKCRITADRPPFYSSGVDYFGPFYVTKGRAQEKRYGVIFTCMASRAMHLEIASSLDTDSFINALRRFMARRGQIKELKSDNGTNFVSGNKELKQALEKLKTDNLRKWFEECDIAWSFQPPYASHFGGVWEREIRTVRKVLGALMQENQTTKLTDETLTTLMCEIENILNNRPITTLSNDPTDLEPLTPNHLLLMSYATTFPPGIFEKDDLYVRRRWKQVQFLANLFWTRWRREYLPLLQERQKWHKEKRSHKVGDLVLVVDQLLPRNIWCMGRIVEVAKDSKDNVRVAKVKVSRYRSGKDFRIATTIIERAIVKLVLLRKAEEL